MGKRNKNKQKISGPAKTAMKTEKKMNAKRRKEMAGLGEEDIEKVVAQIEREESQRLKVVETLVNQPTRRVNFTLTPHPFKDELIMFGGEFYDGQKTTVYGDMYFYNINKKTWTLMKAPGAPPPRCGHQTLATPNHKGELWIFGGEFSSPSESQFYHYKDLWVYHIGDKKWEKIVAPGGPSSRSGHRMLYRKKQLIVFGGFHDNLRDFKYYNDLYIFDLTSYTWGKVDLTGNIPPPRSGCITLATSDNKILVYGGYSKERIKKDIDRGQVHTDMFILTPDERNGNNLKWKSIQVKHNGAKVSPRCSSSAALCQSNIAYVFGGVYDKDEDEEHIRGIFYNDLLTLDIEKYQWRIVNLYGDKEKARHRRKKQHEIEVDDDDSNEERSSLTKTEEAELLPAETVDDGIFRMTIGSAPQALPDSDGFIKGANSSSPSPRMNPGLAVKNNMLYLYGGMYENGNRVYTYNDFYKLNLHKLNEWVTIIKDDISNQLWFASDSSESDDSSDDTDEYSEDDLDVDEK